MRRIGLIGLMMVGLLIMGLGIRRAEAVTTTYLYDIFDPTVLLARIDADYALGMSDIYTYTVTNLGYPSGLEKFRVRNLYHFPITFLTTPTGWSSFNWTGAGDWYFEWSTATTAIAKDASKTYAITTVSSVPGLQKADVWDGPSNQGTGKTLSPTPEPTSLLLLGSGLIGIALLGAAARRKIRA